MNLLVKSSMLLFKSIWNAHELGFTIDIVWGNRRYIAYINWKCHYLCSVCKFVFKGKIYEAFCGNILFFFEFKLTQYHIDILSFGPNNFKNDFLSCSAVRLLVDLVVIRAKNDRSLEDPWSEMITHSIVGSTYSPQLESLRRSLDGFFCITLGSLLLWYQVTHKQVTIYYMHNRIYQKSYL